LGYEYDEVGNRIGMTRDGSELTFTYDDNNKLTYVEATSPTASATMAYDNAGNMTSVTGTLYENKTMVFNDDNQLTSISYGGVTDTYTYNWEGLRTRTRLNGTYHRYLYNGERVLQDLTDDGEWHATYTTENGSYQGMLLGLKRYDMEQERFPLYDNIGTALGLVDYQGTITDTYELDTFGTPSGPAQGSTPNPYRYGGAWGYITDPSGLLQLGARYYWPEVGRFVSQDPARDEVNWYTYVGNKPTVGVDPDGEFIVVILVAGWAVYKGVTTGMAVANVLFAGYLTRECIRCTDRAAAMRRSAAERWKDDPLRFQSWDRAARPGTECAEVCHGAAVRVITALVWVGTRYAPLVLRASPWF
jgi:RHS repeat-associated protein